MVTSSSRARMRSCISEDIRPGCSSNTISLTLPLLTIGTASPQGSNTVRIHGPLTLRFRYQYPPHLWGLLLLCRLSAWTWFRFEPVLDIAFSDEPGAT
jgi:hypothetical protein